MTVVDYPGDSDVDRLIKTIQELSAQLADNRAVAHSLHSAAGAAKVHPLQPCLTAILSKIHTEPGHSFTERICITEVSPLHLVLAQSFSCC